MKMAKNVLVICSSLLIATSIQTKAQTKLKATVADLAFMAGNWQTTTEWGDMDETWSKPSGNSIMCSYRCIKDGKVVFYEFIVIENSDSVPVMSLHHFAPGNNAWEEKPYQYPLILLEKNKAVFESTATKTKMTFTRISQHELQVILVRDKNGKVETNQFDYKLTKP